MHRDPRREDLRDTKLDNLLAFMRRGDSLVVTRMDCLVRSLRGLRNNVHEPRRRARAIKQPIDTSTAAGKALLDMLGLSVEFETNLRRKRQM